jgi:hypothetical protein
VFHLGHKNRTNKMDTYIEYDTDFNRTTRLVVA